MGGEMGPLLALVWPCFRKNGITTSKFVSFLCNLDYFLLKNVIVFIFGRQVSKWHSFEKRAIFDLVFTFSSHQGKTQKFLRHIFHLHKYTYSVHVFCLTNFAKKKNTNFIMYGFSLMRLLVLILIRELLEQSMNNKMVSTVYYY